MKDKKKRGMMCISLDTELFWGVHDTENYDSYGENVYNGHMYATPRILEVFEQYQIHATWAIVGATMAKDKETLNKFLPPKSEWPSYAEQIRSSYRMLNEIGKDVEKDRLYLGPDIIKKILSTKNQYIGSHTFSHYYCRELGQTKEQFDADIQSASEIANSLDIKMTSIVFPKNEINEDYVSRCQKAGFKVYRGIEENWIYKLNNQSLIHRALRFIDSYLPISGSNTFVPIVKNGLLNVRGSRILRPYNSSLKWFEKMKIERVKSQMRTAARRGRIFHLWWHPHNFGKNLEKNMENLEQILEYYQKLKLKYGFESKSMEEIQCEVSNDVGI